MQPPANDNVIALPGLPVPVPTPELAVAVTDIIRQLQPLVVNLDAQSRAPLGSFPLVNATLTLNTDGSVSHAWAPSEPPLDALYRLLWGLRTLERRIMDQIEALSPSLSDEEDDDPAPPADTPTHEPAS